MYGTNLSQNPVTYPEIAPSADLGNTSDPVYRYALGTVFDTPSGPKPIEALQVGDTVRDHTGVFRTIVWLRKDRIARHDRSGPEALNAVGHRTRFPGVRFVRGRPADVVFHVMFAPEALEASLSKGAEEYTAEFSSSRVRDRDTDDEGDAAVAAE